MRIQYLKEGSPDPPDFECDDYPIEGDWVIHSWESPYTHVIKEVSGRVVKTEWASHTAVIDSSAGEVFDIDPSLTAIPPAKHFYKLGTSIVVKITLEDDDYAF